LVECVAELKDDRWRGWKWCDEKYTVHLNRNIEIVLITDATVTLLTYPSVNIQVKSKRPRMVRKPYGLW